MKHPVKYLDTPDQHYTTYKYRNAECQGIKFFAFPFQPYISEHLGMFGERNTPTPASRESSAAG